MGTTATGKQVINQTLKEPTNN